MQRAESVGDDPAAVARSRLYALLGACISVPDREARDDGNWTQRMDDLADVLATLPYAVAARIPPVPSTLSKEALNVDYTCTFLAGPGLVPLHERAYSNMNEQVLFEELLRCYEHFGLDFEKCSNRFWPDALQVEIEFMHYLAYLQAISPGSRHSLLLAQRDFLLRHLQPFCEGISTSLRGCSPSVYTELFGLIGHVMIADATYLTRLLEAG